MTRQRWWLIGGLVLVVTLVVVAFSARKQAWERIHPSWLDPRQPPEGVAANLGVLTAAESLAANGCPPMGACSVARTARMDTMRQWPGHLVDHPDSLVSLIGQIEVG